jgi:transposase
MPCCRNRPWQRDSNQTASGKLGAVQAAFRRRAIFWPGLAWAGLCPSQNESAGKRKSSRLRKGAPWLKTMLVQCAWAASRKNDSYYKAQFHRWRSRRGPKKAICAVAAAMLTAIYHMLTHADARHPPSGPRR